MKRVGLTGGIGMGKSTSARLLEALDVAVVDTDTLARELVKPGQPALDEIVASFGSDLLDADGELRRSQLAKKVFSDSASREKLNSILHPRIRREWQGALERWQQEAVDVAVVVIPLLFEGTLQDRFDATVCVACTRGTQQRRLHERGWSDEEIEQRRSSQWPISEKMDRADHVVWTEGTTNLHREQLERILSQ